VFSKYQERGVEMRIGIMGAMLEEVELLKSDMEIHTEENIGMRTYYYGKLYESEVVLVFSRYGKVASASTATILIERFQVDFIVFTGVAGGATTELNVGDIVVADKLLQHDMDVSAVTNLSRFNIPLLGKSVFIVDGNYIQLAQESALRYIENGLKLDVDSSTLKEFNIMLPKVVIGTIASGDQFIADNKKISWLAKEIDNLKCVEMEGGAVAQICYENDVKFAVFRVISDKADEHANFSFERFVDKAARKFTKGIIKYFIKNINKIDKLSCLENKYSTIIHR